MNSLQKNMEIFLMDTCPYNEAYFERGLEENVSLYQNYRWIPEMTIPMVMTIIDYLEIKRNETVLDFGCAKGYMVKAFRLLYRKAWGIDVSEYAIRAGNSEYCYIKNGSIAPNSVPDHFDYCIAKDVFEHLSLPALLEEVNWIRNNCNMLFAVIPLGDGINFDCPINDKDITHVLKHGANWWKSIFAESKWNLLDFTYRIDGIKDGYYEKYPEAHGFFTLQTKQSSGTHYM